MKKKISALLLAVLLLLTGCADPMLSASALELPTSGKILLPPDPLPPKLVGDMIFYGGSFQSAAAANVAAMLTPESHVFVIIPYIPPDPYRIMGSIGTVGGQNFFDIRRKKGIIQTRGSFSAWDTNQGHFYSTDLMADRRSFSSPAALLVKVMARMDQGTAGSTLHRSSWRNLSPSPVSA